MAVIKCKMCGGDLTLLEGQTVAECEYCGSRQTVPTADSEKKLTLFARANRLRAACEFDKAAGIYESIVADFPEEAEAYWGLVLCKYGIEYVDDPATGKKIPTCHRSSYDSVMDDGNYEQAVENADTVAQKVYREEAKQFERIRKGILEVSSGEKPYDIFICYKETAADGDRTLDSVLAQDLYSALTDKGYRVFFSRITLKGKLGEAYEPYIFAALNSAKVMLAVGTCYEHYNAVWVKNEWSRYLKICEADKSKHLIPCYKDLDPEDMPKEFNHLQGADLGKMGAIQDILFNMEKYIPLKNKNTTVIQEKVVVGGSGNNKIASLLDRGNMALEDGDWAKADSFFEDVLNNDSKNAQAYLDKTLAMEKCRTIDAFVRKRKDACQNVNAQTLKLQPQNAHIDQIVEQYSLAGYVDEQAIRQLYNFDLSYSSQVEGRKRQYREEELYWQNHKQLSRAEKFAVGAVAENLAAEKKALFAALSDRVKKAELAESAAKAKVEQAYEGHISNADAKAAQLYEQGLIRREEHYKSLLLIAKNESDAQKLTQAASAFVVLGDYQDSKNLAEHCRKRAAEEQKKLDIEAERIRILRENQVKAKKAKRKATAIVIGIVAMLVIVAIAVVNFVVIPGHKVEEAKQLLIAGKHEEAIELLAELGKNKKAQDAKYECAIWLRENSEYAKAETLFKELSKVYNDALEQLKLTHYEWALAQKENGEFETAYQMLVDLGNYGEAANIAKECAYLYAEEQLNDHEVKVAKKYFNLAGNYADANTMTLYCQARELAKSDLMKAEELLRQLPVNLRDVSEMLHVINTYKEWCGIYECTSFTSCENTPIQLYHTVELELSYDLSRERGGLEFDITVYTRDSDGKSLMFYSPKEQFDPNGEPLRFTYEYTHTDNKWTDLIVTAGRIELNDYDVPSWMDKSYAEDYVEKYVFQKVS